MRISDWSSDVCSSDLRLHAAGSTCPRPRPIALGRGRGHVEPAACSVDEATHGQQHILKPAGNKIDGRCSPESLSIMWPTKPCDTFLLLVEKRPQTYMNPEDR